MNKLNYIKTGNLVGLISIAFFGLCMFWGVLLNTEVLKTLHQQSLQIAYPGFSMSLWGVLIGVVWAFAYGWIFGILFAWLCRKIHVSN